MSKVIWSDRKTNEEILVDGRGKKHEKDNLGKKEEMDRTYSDRGRFNEISTRGKTGREEDERKTQNGNER